jgi:hypothetical protein
VAMSWYAARSSPPIVRGMERFSSMDPEQFCIIRGPDGIVFANE